MTVRVVDLRGVIGDALDLSSIAAPYRAALIGITSGSVLEFPYNPEAWETSDKPVWNDRNLPGRKTPILDWSRNDAGELSIDYTLQLPDPAQTASFVANLRTAVITPNEITGAPELFQFVAGTFDFVGHIGNLSTNYVRTTPTGDPDTAQIRFTMTANDQGFE